MDREEREALGRRVRKAWCEWAREQPDPKPSWLLPWEELSEPEREADRRIGEALAAPYDAAMTNAVAEIGHLYIEIGRLRVEVERLTQTMAKYNYEQCLATLKEIADERDENMLALIAVKAERDQATARAQAAGTEIGRLQVEVADARCVACGGPVKAAEVAQLRADLTHVTAQRDLVRRAIKLVCLFDGVDDLHAGGCPKRQPVSGACNCGFDDALMGTP